MDVRQHRPQSTERRAVFTVAEKIMMDRPSHLDGMLIVSRPGVRPGWWSRKIFRISNIRAIGWVALGVASLFGSSLWAQDSPVQSTQSAAEAPPSSTSAGAQAIEAAPIFSAGLGFLTDFQGGEPHLHPLFSPVILIPLGSKWLIESRDTFEADLTQEPGSTSFHGSVEKEVDYVQLDYIANPYVTVTVGRYLTPFGIFNERLYPIWIRNLQSDPLILPLATGPSGAGTGAMVRGAFPLNGRLTLNYAAYYSTAITVSPMESSRFAGGRAGIYLPGPRLEVGGSFQHLLQDDHSNSFGFHFVWQPPQLPLDIRSEYARTSQGSGYWAEAAYRFAQPPVWEDFLRHIQLVGRMQEYFVGKQLEEALFPVNTKIIEFGLNYYFRDDLRFVTSYGRQFAAQGNENVWTMAFTYRFVLPLVGGEGR